MIRVNYIFLLFISSTLFLSCTRKKLKDHGQINPVPETKIESRKILKSAEYSQIQSLVLDTMILGFSKPNDISTIKQKNVILEVSFKDSLNFKDIISHGVDHFFTTRWQDTTTSFSRREFIPLVESTDIVFSDVSAESQLAITSEKYSLNHVKKLKQYTFSADTLGGVIFYPLLYNDVTTNAIQISVGYSFDGNTGYAFFMKKRNERWEIVAIKILWIACSF